MYISYIYYQYMYVEMFDFRLLFSYLDLDHFVGMCAFVVICTFDFWKLSLIGSSTTDAALNTNQSFCDIIFSLFIHNIYLGHYIM